MLSLIFILLFGVFCALVWTSPNFNGNNWFIQQLIKIRSWAIRIWAKIIYWRWKVLTRRLLEMPHFNTSKERQQWLLGRLSDIMAFRAGFPNAYKELNHSNMIVADVFRTCYQRVEMLQIYDFFFSWSKHDSYEHLIVILTRPGIMIGKGGTAIDKFSEELSKKMGHKVVIELRELTELNNLMDGFWGLSVIENNY